MMLTRRIVLFATGIAGALWSSPLGFAARPEAEPLPAVRCLRNLVLYPDSARPIGHLYRKACPEEARLDVVARLIMASMALDEGRLLELDDASLRARATSRIRADFAEGHVVEIGAWILSRTEARLCALRV